jgi:hypothetical protein
VQRRRVISAAAALSAAVTLIAVADAGNRDRAQFQLVFDGRHNPALLHEGTFTSSASFCPSGSAEDVDIDAPSETAQRRFRCSGGDFIASVTPLPAEHGGIGVWEIHDGIGALAKLRGKGTWTSTRTALRTDDPATITFRSTWSGVVDFDVDAPQVTIASASAKKLRRPKGTYSVRLTLSLADAAGGPVAYQLEVNEPRTRRGLVFRVGSAAGSPINLTVRAKPPRGARGLQVKLTATDVVGNTATTAKTLTLPRR